MNGESEAQVTHADHDYVLDGGAVGAGRELAIDKDACGEVHLALESRMVELIREGCRRHCCDVPWGIGDYKTRPVVRTRGQNPLNMT